MNNVVAEFFIPTSVPSLKNSKRWTGKYLISSKKVLAYEKFTSFYYKQMASSWLPLLDLIDKPYKISFKFIRGSRHKFDLINAAQLPLDLMVENGLLEDDNADEVIPSFEQYEYNKERPGVIIKLLK